MRTHLCELDETQIARIVELLRADMLARPADYNDAADAETPNMLAFLAPCLQTVLDTPADDYDRNMIQGLTL